MCVNIILLSVVTELLHKKIHKHGKILRIYIIVHGRPQHSGRQTGTTAAPERLFDLLFSDASYSYFPFSRAIAP